MINLSIVMGKFVLLYCFICQALCGWAQTAGWLESPSGHLKAEVLSGKDGVGIVLYREDQKVAEMNTLRFTLDRDIVEGAWQVSSQVRNFVDSSWKPVYGEKSCIPERYHELILGFRSVGNQKEMTLEVRLYDEGLAFRYLFDPLDFWNRTVIAEQTDFLFAGDYTTWATDRAQGSYMQTTLGAMPVTADRPQVVQVGKHCYVAVGEAALVDYARMKLQKSVDGFGLRSVLSGKAGLEMAGYHTPWRYVMVAAHPGLLTEHNYFLLNLNEPNRIANTGWLKPGKVIREVTLTTAGGLACVDFAAANGIEYVEFDAGWYGPENDPASDASAVAVDPMRSKGPLDLHRVIGYAAAKGVGIILYVNMKALHSQLDKILPLYRKWGVKGVKFGFVDVGDQYSTSWLHQAVRKAAKYELMVDIHDEYRPTGYSRTYPNLMTQEGIRGDEESPVLAQTLYSLYNRMIAGAGDYTNCYFADRVTTKMGGRAAQLAKLVAIYSPWQFVFWYDRPGESPARAGGAGKAESVIRPDEVTRFYCSVPVVWDDTRFLEGEMGKYAVIARRSGDDWYVGILNAGEKRRVILPAGLCAEGCKAMLYYQPGKRKDLVNVKEIRRHPRHPFIVEVGENSGCVLWLSENK